MPVNSFDDYYMSWRPKIERGKKALYLMIAEQLENDIKQGVILPGTKLPPQRELADFLDVNVSTVSKAFKQCELKGLLTSTIGSGTFVSYDATTNSYIMPGKKDLEMIEMASIFPDMGANEEIVEKLKEISLEVNAIRLAITSTSSIEELEKGLIILKELLLSGQIE